MARKPMVTRTIKATVVKALCMNLETQTPVTLTFNTSASADDKKLLKIIKAERDTDELVVVKVLDTEEIETLYGMDEETFVKYSVELDKETRKIKEA